LPGVAIAEAEVFRRATEQAQIYSGISLLLTCGNSCLPCGLPAGRQWRLDNRHGEDAGKRSSNCRRRTTKLIEKAICHRSRRVVPSPSPTCWNDHLRPTKISCSDQRYSRRRTSSADHHPHHIFRNASSGIFTATCYQHDHEVARCGRGELGSKTKGRRNLLGRTPRSFLNMGGRPEIRSAICSIRIDITSAQN